MNVQHGVLSEHSLYGVPWEPFLHQPPFYFLRSPNGSTLSGPASIMPGSSASSYTVTMETALFRLLWKIHGPAVALFATTPVIIDGWLLYIERVSYIENALILIIVTGLCSTRTPWTSRHGSASRSPAR